jgi:uncharacterized protein (DUF1501 family)
MANSRRDFLKKGVGLASLSVAMPHLWLRSAMANARGTSTAKTLVVVQLGGGNDGLNCVAPFTTGAYFDNRPTLALQPGEVLPISATHGFHPAMASLLPFFQAEQLAVVLGAGYPQPNRSHFRSMDIWHTAEPIDVEQIGWLGKYADLHLATAGELSAINIGGTLPKSFNANDVVVPSITSLQAYQFLTDPANTGDSQNQIDTFLSTNTRPTATGDELALTGTAKAAYMGSTELQSAAGGYTPAATYPTSRLGMDMQFAAQIILAGVGTRVIYVSTGGYDTHANQAGQHANLLADFANSVAAFQTDIVAQGAGDRVTVMAFSEFGRRVEENGSAGFDHGTAGPMFLLGNGIAGGIYGEQPSLTSLDTNGDLIYTVDFRTVYSDILGTWLEVDAAEILDGQFTPLGTFKTS